MEGTESFADLTVAPLNPAPHLMGQSVLHLDTAPPQLGQGLDHAPVRASVERALDAIRAQNASKRAFITVFEQRALERADELESAATQKPLLGETVAVKDCISVVGAATTCGTASRREAMAEDTAPSVLALEFAGGVVVGTTNLHEWAFGATSQNEAYGAVANPWRNDRISGGSSGGSAAAVATGMASVALGTDTGGSIRLPASYCGVAGLKVTTGTVSAEGCFPLSWTMDSIGPLAATVDALAAPLDALLATGERHFEPRSLPALDGLRVGVWPGVREAGRLDGGVHAVFAQVLARLEAEVAQVVDVRMPNLDIVSEAQMMIVMSEAAAVHSGDGVERDLYEDNVRELLELGDRVTARDYVNALRHRQVVWKQIERSFGQVDVVISPTTPCPAPLIGAETVTWPDGSTESVLAASIRYLLLWNFIGAPCLSFPCGLSDGLPVGLQVAARPGSDRALATLGSQLEALLRPPETAVPPA